MDTTQPDDRLRRTNRNFRSMKPIDRLLAAGTVAVVALTILTAAWAVASIRHQLASSPSHLSGEPIRCQHGANRCLT
jgi:hypothetical protein